MRRAPTLGEAVLAQSANPIHVDKIRRGWCGALLSLALASGCGAQSAGEHAACTSDLPEGFRCQQALSVEQSECSGNATGETLTPSVHWTTDGKALHIEDVRFRCKQSVCAYVDTSSRGSTAQVLLQPCDMSPSTVYRCDCGYSFDVPISLPSTTTGVSVQQRSDAYGGGEPTSRVIGNVAVGATAKLCDDSTALRFAMNVAGGNLSGLPPALSELGWALLLIDGQCRYYAMTQPDREIRTGVLSDTQAQSFSLELSLGAWDGLSASGGCSDASGQNFAFGPDRASISCASTALSVAGDRWLEQLYDQGTAVGGPVRYWVLEASNSQWPESNPDVALPYPLREPPSEVSDPFEPGNVSIASGADATKLRELRAQYQATTPIPLAPEYSVPVVVATPETGTQYCNLSLRDTVPFEVDGQLKIDDFIE